VFVPQVQLAESIHHRIDMVTSRSLIIAFVLVTLGCVFAQGAALDADDRTGNFVQCFQTCVTCVSPGRVN